MKTIRAFVIRSTVGGIHHDALYLDEPPQSALDAKLAHERELHGDKSPDGDDRWVRTQEIGLIVDDAKHVWAKNAPQYVSAEEKAANARAEELAAEGEEGFAHAQPAIVSGTGHVQNP